MKGKIITFIATCSCVIFGGSVYAHHTRYNIPAYVQQASLRAESFLTKDYGRAECRGNVAHDNKWKINCTILDKREVYEFTVLPSDKAPYPVARSFYLKADNENARKSSSTGLMQYLQIDTVNSPL